MVIFFTNNWSGNCLHEASAPDQIQMDLLKNLIPNDATYYTFLDHFNPVTFQVKLWPSEVV